MPDTSPARRLQIAFDADRSEWSERGFNSMGSDDRISIVRETWKKRIVSCLSIGLLRASKHLSPSGAGHCDHNPLERCCNCVTSAPYAAIGIHTIRNRRSPWGKAWGWSLVGVGAASFGFHSSQGTMRPWMRRIDFWTISGASNLMLRAIYPNTPIPVTAIGFLATPFRPFLVSFLNSSLMELKYIDRARKNPKLRKAHRLHATATLVGLGCFALEDLCPSIPLMHASWHILSSLAVATINDLAADEEDRQSRLHVQ